MQNFTGLSQSLIIDVRTARSRLIGLALNSWSTLRDNPLKAFAAAGLTGDALMALSGATEFNPPRVVAALFGTAGTLILLKWGGGAKTAEQDASDRPAEANEPKWFKKIISPRRFPVETAFALHLATSTLIMAAGADATGLEGKMRIGEILTGSALFLAFLVGICTKDKPSENPAQDGEVIEAAQARSKVQFIRVDWKGLTKSLAAWMKKGPPLRLSAILFSFATCSTFVAGVMALDPWMTSAGLSYAAGNYALAKSRKTAQVKAPHP